MPMIFDYINNYLDEFLTVTRQLFLKGYRKFPCNYFMLANTSVFDADIYNNYQNIGPFATMDYTSVLGFPVYFAEKVSHGQSVKSQREVSTMSIVIATYFFYPTTGDYIQFFSQTDYLFKVVKFSQDFDINTEIKVFKLDLESTPYKSDELNISQNYIYLKELDYVYKYSEGVIYMEMINKYDFMIYNTGLNKEFGIFIEIMSGLQLNDFTYNWYNLKFSTRYEMNKTGTIYDQYTGNEVNIINYLTENPEVEMIKPILPEFLYRIGTSPDNFLFNNLSYYYAFSKLINRFLASGEVLIEKVEIKPDWTKLYNLINSLRIEKNKSKILLAEYKRILNSSNYFDSAIFMYVVFFMMEYNVYAEYISALDKKISIVIDNYALEQLNAFDKILIWNIYTKLLTAFKELNIKTFLK
jgi:hypothetical protein